MPYLIPGRTPLTPEEVDRAFDYLLALQMGGGNYASGRTPATPELACLLLRLAENIVFPGHSKVAEQFLGVFVGGSP
ncbi:hypothetical protein AMK16_26885 [Streptomyces sp. CB00455]|uniref:hypothetical protein n=1 Tax=Streptomyces sp. CB00455 TaxID=1703927 RepID=UPI00093A7EB6|nr:hypothetical protein [Streptomyces sp. CB00455]OKK16281.1 hypothetical protein AMK16_26885 [Streptomyces sp. CB00455]